jgi:hypothetical protein
MIIIPLLTRLQNWYRELVGDSSVWELLAEMFMLVAVVGGIWIAIWLVAAI